MTLAYKKLLRFVLHGRTLLTSADKLIPDATGSQAGGGNEMLYDPHEIADAVIAKLAANKVIVEADKSTNRYNQKSAYLHVPVVGEVRISDHAVNEYFRPGMRHQFVGSSADVIVETIIGEIEVWRAAAPAKAAVREAKIAAELAAKQALNNENDANRQRKIDFFASRPDLLGATETVRRKAWNSFKKEVLA